MSIKFKTTILQRDLSDIYKIGLPLIINIIDQNAIARVSLSGQFVLRISSCYLSHALTSCNVADGLPLHGVSKQGVNESVIIGM